jgi:hypothetical protein
MPETYDLDQLFMRLEHDVAASTHAPGASVAVRTHRRRRRTTLGAVVAGLALVAGVTAVGLSRGSTDRVEPVTRVPAPAPFDGTHLSAATAGWTPSWGPETKAVSDRIASTFGGPCMAALTGGRSTGLRTLANAHDDAALAEFARYRSIWAPRSWFALTSDLERCSEAKLVSSYALRSGAQGMTYRVTPTPSDVAPEYIWIATTDHRVGELKIFGQSSPLPRATDPQVARFLLAALQDRGSYGPGRTQETPQIDQRAFARALGSWPSGWSRSRGHGVSGVGSACFTPRWRSGATATQHQSLGGNGVQDLATFPSRAAARRAATTAVDAFRSCVGHSLSSAVQNPRSLLVSASGPLVDGWVAQRDDTVSVVRVPAGATTPPSKVTADVGDLMFGAISAFSRETAR